jgi:glycosyltransferase involved in cell wall biosynthesis
MIDNGCKVSIIIPVYNTEQYVHETVISACNQTLHEIEIICVNDGCTDNSPAILKALAESDNRIRIIDQLNAGQSVARNTGIVNARGKYIYFLDSDDLIDPNTLEECYELCERGNYDFVTFDSDVHNPSDITIGNGLRYDRSTSLFEKLCYTGIESINLQLAKTSYTPSVPLLFIRAQYIKDTKLSFHAGIIHEDQLFTALLYFRAKRMAYLPKQFFHRRIRSDSTMTTRFSWKNVQGYLTVTDELIKAKDTLSKEAQDTIDIILSQMLDNVVRWEAYKLPREERLSLAIICLRRYMKYIRISSIIYLFAKSIIKKKPKSA